MEKGGKVTVITPEGNVTPAGMVPRLKQFNLVGTVKTGIYELDNSLAMTHIRDAQTLYRTETGFGGLRLKLADPQNAPAIVARLLPAAASDKCGARLDVQQPVLLQRRGIGEKKCCSSSCFSSASSPPSTSSLPSS